MVHAGFNSEFRARKDHEDGWSYPQCGRDHGTNTHGHQAVSNLKSEKGNGMGSVEVRKVMGQSSALCQDVVGPESGK